MEGQGRGRIGPWDAPPDNINQSSLLDFIALAMDPNGLKDEFHIKRNPLRTPFNKTLIDKTLQQVPDQRSWGDFNLADSINSVLAFCEPVSNRGAGDVVPAHFGQG